MESEVLTLRECGAGGEAARGEEVAALERKMSALRAVKAQAGRVKEAVGAA